MNHKPRFMNLRAARLATFSNQEPVPGMGPAKVAELLDNVAFQPITVNNSFAVCWKDAAGQSPTPSQQHFYTCRLRALVIPKNMYRIPDITKRGQASPSRYPLLSLPEKDEDNTFIEAGELLILDEPVPATNHESPIYRTTFSKRHPCQPASPNTGHKVARISFDEDMDCEVNLVDSRSGGNGRPCITLARTRNLYGEYDYLALSWNWKETYAPYAQADADTRMREGHDELVRAFGDISPVPLVLMSVPDGGFLWLPVLSSDEDKLSELHDLLHELVQHDQDFDIPYTRTYFFDGPDVGVIVPEDRWAQLTTSPAQA